MSAVLDEIHEALEEHKPREVYALFSGGHDSVCSTHLASTLPGFAGVIHCHTGIGIQETLWYVVDVCEAQGWPLYVLNAEAEYEDLVMERGGFPSGPQSHNSMLFYLKEKQLRAFVQSRKRHRLDRIGLVSGIRKDESERRMGADISVPAKREGAYLWLNPILEWVPTDKRRYMEEHGIPTNRVVDLLERSGECLCGALSRREELKDIALWFPEVAQRIYALEACAKAAGLDDHFWATRSKVAAGQEQLEGMTMGRLCVGCAAREPE